MEQQQSTTSGSSNAGVINNTSFMMMRIDTSPLIKNLRKALGVNESVIVEDANGNYVEKWIKHGKPRANGEGIMQICNRVETILNQHTVQANLDKDRVQYCEFVARVREEITNVIVTKCYDWDIDDSDINDIIDSILDIVELFLTRSLDNKERESYSSQFQAKEVVTNQPSRGGLLSIADGMGMGAKRR